MILTYIYALEIHNILFCKDIRGDSLGQVESRCFLIAESSLFTFYSILRFAYRENFY